MGNPQKYTSRAQLVNKNEEKTLEYLWVLRINSSKCIAFCYLVKQVYMLFEYIIISPTHPILSLLWGFWMDPCTVKPTDQDWVLEFTADLPKGNAGDKEELRGIFRVCYFPWLKQTG